MTPTNENPGVPRSVGHYRIESPLGAGVMGAVYRATDLRDGQTIALKLLRPHLAGSPSAVRRFVREARIASLFRSEHVVRVLDYGEAAGQAYLAMEFVAGTTLAVQLRRGGLGVPRALAIADAIAEALEEAEDLHVVHRDLKPDNVLLGNDGSIKVADFGIAHTEGAAMADAPTGQILGGLEYMAPEVFAGTTERRSDLYSLGAVLFHMLAGGSPFAGNAVEVMRLHQQAPVDRARLKCPDSIAAIVARCLAKDPDDRFQSASDLRVSIASTAAELGIDLTKLDATVGARRPHWLPHGWLRGLPASVSQPSRRQVTALGVLAATSLGAALFAALPSERDATPLTAGTDASSTAIVAESPAVPSTQVVFREDFSHSSTALRFTSVPGQSVNEVLEGQFRMRLLAGNAIGGSGASVPGNWKDVSVSADAEIVGSAVTRAFLTCRSSVGGEYRLRVEPASGVARIERVERAQGRASTTPLVNDAAGLIQRGDGTNRLRLDCIGPELSGFVDGVLVVVARDSTLTEGAAGVAMGSGGILGEANPASEVRFDNLTVSVPK